jgi:hypothetical protein
VASFPCSSDAYRVLVGPYHGDGAPKRGSRPCCLILLPPPRGPRGTPMGTPAGRVESTRTIREGRLRAVQAIVKLSSPGLGLCFPNRLRCRCGPARRRGALFAWPTCSRSRCAGRSVACQLLGRASSGVCGAAQKARKQFEFGVSISGADLVHGGVHPRVKAQKLPVSKASRSVGHTEDGFWAIRWIRSNQGKGEHEYTGGYGY